MNDGRRRRQGVGALAVAGALFVGGLRTSVAAELPVPSPEPGRPQATESPAPAEAGEVPRVQCFTRHEDAQISRRGGHLLEAREALRICSRAACPSAIRADCVEWLEQVERSIPSVVVTARDGGLDLTDLRVLIDGEVAAERLTGAAIEADPGEHRFRFEAPGRPVIERTVLMSEGVKRRAIDLDFAPPAPPSARGPTGSLQPPTADAKARLGAFDYVAGSLAVAALGTSVYFGVWALVSRDELEGRCAPLCSEFERESVDNKLMIADLALGVAAFSMVFLYLHRFSGSPTLSASRPRSLSFYFGPSRSGGGLGLRGGF